MGIKVNNCAEVDVQEVFDLLEQGADQQTVQDKLSALLRAALKGKAPKVWVVLPDGSRISSQEYLARTGYRSKRQDH